MNGKRNILFVDKDAYPSLEEPELFDTLAAGAGSIRVERIVSNGRSLPKGNGTIRIWTSGLWCLRAKPACTTWMARKWG